MMELKSFFETGEILGLKLGLNIEHLDNDNLHQMTYDGQYLYDYDIEGIKLRLGTKNGNINLIILRLEVINDQFNLYYNNIDVRKINLLQLLSLFDNDGLEWKFLACNLKVLRGILEKSRVEFIYDCNLYEDQETSNILDNSNYFIYSFQIRDDLTNL